MLQEKLVRIKIKEIVRKSLLQTITQAEVFQLREWDKHHDLENAILMRKEAVREVDELECETESYLLQLESQSRQDLERLMQREHEQVVVQDLQITHDERLADETVVADVVDLIPIATTTLLGMELL